MSERFASLDQRTLVIAHEINSPLAAIADCSQGVLNSLEKDRYEADLFRTYLRIIQEEVRRCKGITTSML